MNFMSFRASARPRLSPRMDRSLRHEDGAASTAADRSPENYPRAPAPEYRLETGFRSLRVLPAAWPSRRGSSASPPVGRLLDAAHLTSTFSGVMTSIFGGASKHFTATRPKARMWSLFPCGTRLSADSQ